MALEECGHQEMVVLSKDLKCLYQDNDFSDFQLKCDSVSIPVHRAILSARSPVFKTMLSSNMKEAASGCVYIVDMDPSTLTLFLCFLYTGSVEKLQRESAIKLYYAADKYQVSTLKRKCVNFLSKNVSISNVCEILTLADKHQDKELTIVVYDFVLSHYKDVLQSSEWKSFMEKEPSLAVKTLTQIVDKNHGDVFVHKQKEESQSCLSRCLYTLIILFSVFIIFILLMSMFIKSNNSYKRYPYNYDNNW